MSTTEMSDQKSKSVESRSPITNIADEEFYRILQELRIARDDEKIDEIASLWRRSLSIGWEGDIVRNAICDSMYYLCKKYGMKGGKPITHDKVIRRQTRYRFLNTCREGSLQELAEYDSLSDKEAERGMASAIQAGNLDNAGWFIANYFHLPSEKHLICAIEAEQLLVAKNLLQRFVSKTEESRENVCAASIKVGWYLGCVGIQKQGAVNYSKMIAVALKHNQIQIAQFFQRKGGKAPMDCIATAVEKNHPEVVAHLLNVKFQDVESAIIRCLDFPEHVEIMKLLLSNKTKTFNALRLLAFSRDTVKLKKLKSLVLAYSNRPTPQ